MYFRWHEPPPLTDCCRPPWWLERLVWWLRSRWWRVWHGREKIVIPTVIQMPVVKAAYPGLKLDEIVSVQPMTGAHGDTFSLGRLKIVVKKP